MLILICIQAFSELPSSSLTFYPLFYPLLIKPMPVDQQVMSVLIVNFDFLRQPICKVMKEVVHRVGGQYELSVHASGQLWGMAASTASVDVRRRIWVRSVR
jgi:hypothetical protein